MFSNSSAANGYNVKILCLTGVDSVLSTKIISVYPMAILKNQCTHLSRILMNVHAYRHVFITSEDVTFTPTITSDPNLT